LTALSRFLTVCLCAFLLVTPVYSQNIVRLASIRASDTISADADYFVVNVGGMASMRLQSLDSYSGTWEVQCSVDGGTTYDADDEVNMFLEGGSAGAVQEVTDTIGVWTAGVAGCTHVKVIATAGFAASDTVIAVVAVASGGSASGGGSSGAVEVAEGGATAQVTATAGGSLQVECTSGCAGTGGTSMVDDAAFTAGTSALTPAGFTFDDAAPDSVNEGDIGTPRMSANRNIFATIRDAAGNERGTNVNASNQLAIAGPVTVVSGGIASGAIASGAVASGAFASGALASGSVASGAIASGAIAAGAIAAGATAIADNEDVLSADGDRGVKMLATRKLTPANVSGTDGDYEFLQMSVGRLWTSTIGNIANDGAAAATDRLTTLPGITETAAPTRTNGRNAALSMTVGGAARVMLTDAAGDALTLASDATFGTSTYTETTSRGPLVGGVRTDTPAALGNTTNEVVPLALSALNALYVASASDPCSRLAKSYFVINVAAAATTEIANASGSNHWYICSVNVVAGAAQGFTIAEDDTDGCGSITAGMNGGTTGATGWQFAANGGAAHGDGSHAIMRSATGGRYLCMVVSTNAQTSGTISYVSAP